MARDKACERACSRFEPVEDREISSMDIDDGEARVTYADGSWIGLVRIEGRWYISPQS